MSRQPKKKRWNDGLKPPAPKKAIICKLPNGKRLTVPREMEPHLQLFKKALEDGWEKFGTNYSATEIKEWARYKVVADFARENLKKEQAALDDRARDVATVLRDWNTTGLGFRNRPMQIPEDVSSFHRITRAFEEAARAPFPTPGPGQKLGELRKFPLPRDPYLVRRNMIGDLRSWMPGIASILGTHPDGAALVTQDKAIIASDDVTLLWAVVGDYLLENLFPRLPQVIATHLGRELNKVGRYFSTGAHRHSILARG